MLLTNILLGIIIYVLFIIFGVLCNIDKKLLSNAEYLKLKKLRDDLMARGGRVKDDKRS